MNDLLSSILQGVVEGLTEFLPVSSTAHILLTQELMGTDRESPFWKMFAVVIQLGAILSVVVFFRSRLLVSHQSFWTAWNQAATPRRDSAPSSTPPDSAPNHAAPIQSWTTHP